MVVIAVDHDALDYELISRNAKIIFDLKNVYKRKPAKNIVVL
jgi:UDP-N-acetyl-D-mannosaminuronate dehydrogenase